MPQILEYECPACSGKMEFDVETQMMKCPYCDTVVDVDAMSRKKDDIDQMPQGEESDLHSDASRSWEEEEYKNIKIYSCESCGGEIIAEQTTGASSCPYCGNPVVMRDTFSGSLKPDLVIPFKVSKKQAVESLKKHYKGKPFLPKVFSDENHIDEIRGMYVPFRLFDADVHNDSVFDATKVRTWMDSKYSYTETSHYHVTRSADLSFAAVPVDASVKMPDELMESIEPFDLSQAEDFQTAYLSGFLADKYDVEPEQCAVRAKQRINESTEQRMRDSVSGYSSVSLEKSSTRVNKSKASYALYPVWLLNTSWNGQRYTFAMNGQTGKTAGNLPTDKKKMFAWGAGLSAGLSAAFFGIYYFLLQGGLFF